MPVGKKIKKIDSAYSLDLATKKNLIQQWKDASSEHNVKIISLCAGSLNKCEIWGRDRELAMRIAKQTIDACHALDVKIMLFPFFGPSEHKKMSTAKDDAKETIAQPKESNLFGKRQKRR